MKRKIAAALAIVMVGAQYVSPFVYADDPVPVDGNSSVAYVDDSVLKVVVPTDKALNFTIDPEGLLAIADGKVAPENATKDNLKDYSGRIVGNTALVFANKSIKPVKITTNFKVDGSIDSNLIVSSNTGTAVKDASSNSTKMLFMAVPNKASSPIALSYKTGETASSSESLENLADAQKASNFSGYAAAKGIVFTKAANTVVDSVLPAAAFKYSYDSEGQTFDYTLDTSKKNSAAGFTIAGFCNPYADYSKMKDVKVTASYSFTAATADEADVSKTPKKQDSYAVISAKIGTNDADFIDVHAKGAMTKSEVKGGVVSSSSPRITDSSTNYKLVADTAVVINLSYGKGDTAATGLSEVKFTNKGTDTSSSTWTTAQYQLTAVDGGAKFTVPANLVNSMLNNSNITGRKFTITFNDKNRKRLSCS